MDVQQLIERGSHKWCPCNKALILTQKTRCDSCHHRPVSTAAPAVRKATPKRAAATFAAPQPGTASFLNPQAVAPLASLDGGCLWIVAAGKPVTQGSMKAVGGFVKHNNGPELHAWRDTLTKEALRQVGQRWESLDVPVSLDVVLTVPAPKTLSTTAVQCNDGPPRIPPMRPPDVDKLLRAVQDALSPNDNRKKGEAVKLRDRRFRLLVDDSRIVDSSARKTFPRPRHTHPWALDYPGAVIRVAPLGSDLDPLPLSTLEEPGLLPAPAALLDKAVRARQRI